MAKIPVYFIPGMAASHLMYEYLRLPEANYDCFYLSWNIPNPNESMADYAKRFAAKIKHDQSVLVGCSFGGILAQELKLIVNARQVIIISSVKCRGELPFRFHLAKMIGLHHLIPVSLLANIDYLHRYRFNRYINLRLRLYKKYLVIKNRDYWQWAIKQIVLWERKVPDDEVLHIHGTNDEVFPAKNIRNYVSLPGGTHIMVINRYKWLNENLPLLIAQ